MWYRPNTVSRPAFWPPVGARQQPVTLRQMLFRIIVPVIIHSRLAPVLVLILDLVMLEIVEAALDSGDGSGDVGSFEVSDGATPDTATDPDSPVTDSPVTDSPVAPG